MEKLFLDVTFLPAKMEAGLIFIAIGGSCRQNVACNQARCDNANDGESDDHKIECSNISATEKA